MVNRTLISLITNKIEAQNNYVAESAVHIWLNAILKAKRSISINYCDILDQEDYHNHKSFSKEKLT